MLVNCLIQNHWVGASHLRLIRSFLVHLTKSRRFFDNHFGVEEFFWPEGVQCVVMPSADGPTFGGRCHKNPSRLRDLFCMQALRPRHATRVDGKMLNMYEWPWLHCIFGPNEKKLFVFFQVLIDSQYHDKIK